MRNAREKSPVSFPVFPRQLPSPEHSRGSGGSGEPIKAFCKLQDRFPRLGSVNCPATSCACSARSSHSQASFKVDDILVLHRFSHCSCPLFLSGHPSASEPSRQQTVINHITRAVAPDEARKKPLPTARKVERFRGSGSGRLYSVLSPPFGNRAQLSQHRNGPTKPVLTGRPGVADDAIATTISTDHQLDARANNLPFEPGWSPRCDRQNRHRRGTGRCRGA